MRKFMLFFICILVILFACVKAGAYTDEVNGSKWGMQLYKANFFVFDFSHTYSTSKLQLGFKIPIIENWELYFAYSQLMFWQLRAESQPFYDLNYNPEFFYRLYFASNKKVGLDLGILEHESNGVDGPDTRAWNRSYLRFFQEWEFEKGPHFYFNIKAWVPYFLDETNLDIAKYRGIFEVYLTLEDFMKGDIFGKSDLTLRFYPGGEYLVNPLEGAMEIAWRFKTRLFDSTLPMFELQFFWGHAECLKDYNTATWRLRLGFGF